ncbi:MAG TPA: DUF559 domain-containing protein [Gemmatimonadales bacterium]|nr:DUF559 domain-containing protein [Gemmatimonadales bacterium]
MPTKREIELARYLRRRATDAEREAWEMLRARRCHGMKFKRQEPLGNFIVDFYCPQLKLVIELDGPIHTARIRPRRMSFGLQSFRRSA